ncbi:MAG: glycosyl transferase family 28 [Chitinophagaceae bacterium]|nr:glycosyl transferase family 28 [Chitinophagaceae bacterium]
MVAPLDWGLGHATRCIPIVNDLIKGGYKVIIAASAQTEVLLKKEFPQLLFLQLPGYNISYTKNKFWLPLKILQQLPKIFYAIKTENKWLQQKIDEQKIDAVISDNRPGLYSKKAKCIYITHQLTIKAKLSFIENWLQKIHYKYINKFSECWIPDYEGENNLAGDLSHPQKLPKTPVQYIGPLSRFVKKELPVIYDAAIILSGPEPQRTIFENIILAQIKHTAKKLVLVRGLPNQPSNKKMNYPNVVCYNFLNSEELNNLLFQAKIIICRSGYSSIMDLEAVQKKAVIVATPGQTEQEYLAKTLAQKNKHIIAYQNNFDLLKYI